MSTRYDKTVADYLVIAVSPALIMTLIGALVFFLLEVFYQGTYFARLHYILAWFIFAAVLVGRISIEEGSERAVLFALPLAGATMVAINRFVEFHGAVSPSFSMIINFGLIGLIWWCAHMLTWDCTMIDETAPSSGQGLLDAAGLGTQTGAEAESESESSDDDDGSKDDRRPQGRWNAWIDRRRKPHAPGVWIVYFSLAALPLFGLGQLAIPSTQVLQRRYAFCLLAIYVASGLGLLLTTSFLGLRRYLRQRRLPMPMVMAGTWIALGCILIFAVMGISLFVPRPNAEYAISQLPNVMGSPDQSSSKYGMGRDGVRDGKPGRPSPDEDKGPTIAGTGKKKQPDGKPAQVQGGGEKGGKGQGGDKQDKSSPEGEKPPESNAGGEKGQAKDDAPKSSSSDGPKQGDSPRQQASGEPRTNPSRDAASGQAEKPQEVKSRPPAEARPAESSPPPPAPPDVSPSFSWLLPALQYLFYAAVIGFALYWVWRRRAELLAALRSLLSELESLWSWMLGQRKKVGGNAAEANAAAAQKRPFSSFADPFATGVAERLSAEQLVRYTFEALEAWAGENGCARDADQTPHEFARYAGRRARSLRQPALHLANLYCEAVYAPARLRLASTQPLEELWQQLRAQPAAISAESSNDEMETHTW